MTVPQDGAVLNERGACASPNSVAALATRIGTPVAVPGISATVMVAARAATAARRRARISVNIRPRKNAGETASSRTTVASSGGARTPATIPDTQPK